MAKSQDPNNPYDIRETRIPRMSRISRIRNPQWNLWNLSDLRNLCFPLPYPPNVTKSPVVARKESRETRYGLRVVDRKWPAIGVQSDITEATEILCILSAIIRKLS